MYQLPHDFEPSAWFHIPTDPHLLLDSSQPFIHRDLSWLQFNERVLAQARASAGNPVLERLKFLAISASNLDEFFMIRFASLERAIHAAKDKDARVHHLQQVRQTILTSAAKFGVKQLEALDLLISELSGIGIHISRHHQNGQHALECPDFENTLLPLLPQPEPYNPSLLLRAENLQLVVLVGNQFMFYLPKSFPLIHFCAESEKDASKQLRAFFADNVLLHYLPKALATNLPISIVRIARDADFSLELDETDTESVPDVIRSGLRIRERGKPMRLQYIGKIPPKMLREITIPLKLDPNQVFSAPGTLCLHSLWGLIAKVPDAIRKKSGVTYPEFHATKAKIPNGVAVKTNVFDELKKSDILLHHPYDSFDEYIHFIEAAASDPAVTTIEQTAYRMDLLSPLIETLKRAAAHKSVRVIIELRARFDEFNNLKLAEELRSAGVEVHFGFGKLKLHAKIAVVTRLEGGVNHYYTHLSTGNYKATTSRTYTDLALITANQALGLDGKHFFDSVWDGQIPNQFRLLVPAPTRLHKRLIHLIKQEIAAAHAKKPAHIIVKVNALVDHDVVEHLYAASRAGVKIELIVRGACALIPGVMHLSENIRVISLVDRYLEHSRIYYFESSQAMYLSSADWMPRNFYSRLELAFPVVDPGVFDHIRNYILATYLADNTKAHELTPQGAWKRISKRSGAPNVRAQMKFHEDQA